MRDVERGAIMFPLFSTIRSLPSWFFRRPADAKCGMLKEPPYAFSKRHKMVLVVICSTGQNFTFNKRGSASQESRESLLENNSPSLYFRKENHANTFRNPGHSGRLAEASQ